MATVRVKHQSNISQYLREKNLDLRTSLPALLHQAGRLVAVSLAFQAQPFGDDDRAEALGKVATTRDIYRVYATPGKAYSDIQDPKAQAGFWKAVRSSAWDRAQKILQKAGNALKFTTIDNFDGGAAHRQLRNNQGRIPPSQKPAMIVRNPQTLKTYVAAETSKVGAGKGGWASCARALGGVRGIPHWITKHDSPGTVIEDYGSSIMKITMINQVPYASAILSPSQKAEAVRIAVDRLRRSILIAFRNSGQAARSTLTD